MRKNKLRAKLLASCASLVLVTATGAAAQTADPVTFDIPSQPLAGALRDFAQQSKLEILFASRLARDQSAPAVRGEMPPAEALTVLLAQTGLSYRTTPTGSLVIEAVQAPQGGSAAGGGAEVEALIVTAQKREEDIQDVPIAISAFSQEALETHQIAGGPDLITQVPNMTFTKTNFSSYSIQLRGIGTQAISATTDPGVAVAFNNTPFIQNRFFEQEFYDLQRVEVLRGPQGTLYGRNATAGVVNIISQKPKFVAEAKLGGDVANYNSTRLEGMVNIPLVEDKAALRLAGAWTKREGYSTNELTGNPIDGRDLWSTRVSLRVSPTDALDMNLIWEHFEENDDRLRSGKQLCKKHVITEVGGIPILSFNQTLSNAGISGATYAAVQPTFSQGCIRESLYSPDAFQTPNGAMVPYYVPLGALGLPTARFDPYANQTQSQDLRVIESTLDPKYRAEADLGELQISWDITENLTLSSETGYSVDFVWSQQDFNRFNTATGAWATGGPRFPTLVSRGIMTPEGEFCDPQLGCSDRLVAVDLSTAEGTQFAQELRLSSDFNGPFNFSVGANFLKYDTEAKYYVFINSVTFTSVLDIFGSFNRFHAEFVPWIPGESDNRHCALDGVLPGDPRLAYSYNCIYIEPNSIENIQDQGHNYFLSRNPYGLISYAAFGEAYYNISDTLKVTGGLRWTVDQKTAPRAPSWIFAGDGSRGHPIYEVVEQEWREPTGRLAIDWKPDLALTDETMVYASYAHGYKAGGANPPPMSMLLFAGRSHPSATRPKTFEPEFIDAYELGAKNTLLDRALTLNLAAFYYDYTGYQISEIVDRSAFNRNFDAEVWGLEVEADWRPLENLKLGFKGGYEKTRIKDGERAVDLMDRTAGNPDWILVRPHPIYPSSCVLPLWLFTPPNFPNEPRGLGSIGGGGPGGCELAYLEGVDPVTGFEYVPYPTVHRAGTTLYDWATGEGTPGAYPGWDPNDESQGHNHGEGFFKELGGNQLPNAPEFTATVSADYTLPLPNEWLATLHTDLYWQSESYWRVFNDHEFNKLDEYFTMNLAAIFTNEDAGWKVMAYVKNVFDRDSITGAFLNSDDTGLTTNVFLTEPRLYGLRVTKEWTGGPLWGSFGARRESAYPFEVELGGQIQRHEAPNDPVAPSFIDEFSGAIDPLDDQQEDLDWGDGRDVKLTWRPNGAFKASLGARFGKTNGGASWVTRTELGPKGCLASIPLCQFFLQYYGYDGYRQKTNYSVSTTNDGEEHTIIDFLVGRDVGMGALTESVVSAGLRHTDLESTTAAHIYGVPNWNYPEEYLLYATVTKDRFDGASRADREFKGIGPALSWEASKAVGNRDRGFVGLDWSLSAGVIFGDRKVSIASEEVAERFIIPPGSFVGQPRPYFPNETETLPSLNISRSESATVPFYGASLGISYKVDRFKIGAGYRWERYQDAIDGGFSEAKEEDRTIDGPYLKVSVGFGN